jgi:hypothetical protein
MIPALGSLISITTPRQATGDHEFSIQEAEETRGPTRLSGLITGSGFPQLGADLAVIHGSRSKLGGVEPLVD